MKLKNLLVLILASAVALWSAQSGLGKVRKMNGIMGKDGVKMILIPAGYFKMGSPAGQGGIAERPKHKVWVDAFYIDQTLVTYAQFDKFCLATGWEKPADDGWGRDNMPVHHLNWNDASAFCSWAKKRLPTEAEWEKAARGGTNTVYYWGDNPAGLGDNAWDSDNSGDQAHPAAQKSMNPYALYDMLGNLWEWCADWYGEEYYFKSPARNPKGPDQGKYKVLRGGSWRNGPDLLRAANRNWSTADVRNPTFGCRCAMTP